MSAITIGFYVYLLGGLLFGIAAMAFRRNARPFGSEEPVLFWLGLIVWPLPAFFLAIRSPGPKEGLTGSKSIPPVSPDELSRYVTALLPGAKIVFKTVSKEHQSWILEVKGNNLEIEFFWGPLSGFGVSDVLVKDDDPDIFRPYDMVLSSIDEAKHWISKRVAGGKIRV